MKGYVRLMDTLGFKIWTTPRAPQHVDNPRTWIPYCGFILTLYIYVCVCGSSFFHSLSEVLSVGFCGLEDV